MIKEAESKRKEVDEKKFTDKTFVAKEYSKLVEITTKRESIKNEYEKVKNLYRDQREA